MFIGCIRYILFYILYVKLKKVWGILSARLVWKTHKNTVVAMNATATTIKSPFKNDLDILRFLIFI